MLIDAQELQERLRHRRAIIEQQGGYGLQFRLIGMDAAGEELFRFMQEVEAELMQPVSPFSIEAEAIADEK